MLSPDRAIVEALESVTPPVHIGESTQPDEGVRLAALAKLSDNAQTILLLPLDELLLEERDQLILATRFERIVAQFDDWAALLLRIAALSVILSLISV
jgi:hypothetical protein